MNDAFEVERLANNIYRLRERYIAPWLRCNIWFVKGRDRDLVIDTGMGLWPLKKTLITHGGKNLTAISTHSHFDHMGGGSDFCQHWGHKLEAESFSKPSTNPADFYPFVRAETFLKDPWPDFKAEQFTLRPAPLTGYLDEGDVIDLGDRYFQVLHVPGHSPGSIALHEEATATLFSGDIVYDGDLIDNADDCDTSLFKQSLHRLNGLSLETIHGGHYDSFGSTRLNQIISNYFEGFQRMHNCDRWVRDQIKLSNKCGLPT